MTHGIENLKSQCILILSFLRKSKFICLVKELVPFQTKNDKDISLILSKNDRVLTVYN